MEKFHVSTSVEVTEHLLRFNVKEEKKTKLKLLIVPFLSQTPLHFRPLLSKIHRKFDI